MIARTEFSFLLQLSNNCAKGVTAFWDLIVPRVCEFSLVLGISVFLWWLAYSAAMHMRPQFSRAWLPHSSREINQIAGGSGPLRSLNFKICESYSCIIGVILRIPLYCKFLMIVVPGWRLYICIYICIYTHMYIYITNNKL